MREVGVFEAKQKLSELVRRAGRGETIGITTAGEVDAMIVACAARAGGPESGVCKDRGNSQALEEMPKHISVKELIEEEERKRFLARTPVWRNEAPAGKAVPHLRR